MKRVAVILAEGFEELEALTVVDVLRRANVICHTVSLEGTETVTSSHNVTIKADRAFDEDLKKYDMIVLPGGLPGSRNLKNSEKVLNLVKYFNDNKKFIGAICAAPIVLGAAGIVCGKNVTSYPGFKEEIGECNYVEELVVVDENIITSRGPATTMPFAYKILELLGCKDYEKIREGMLFNLL